MIYKDELQQIIDLAFDTMTTICKDGQYEVSVFRPSVPPKKFENYDPKKNFQIWLKDGDRSFKPNHLRVMIDIYLRVRSKPELKAEVAQAMDAIFYGEDPKAVALKFENIEFPHFLNPFIVTLYLSQLFILEQAYGYHKPSKYSPPTLFYQGWVRQVIDSEKEIDNLVMSIGRFQPPSARYTCEDDKNNKKYNEDHKPLWWLS